jgi:hypothetical protein
VVLRSLNLGGKIVTDFPAAHSMDTTWFAIDADGYIGIFDTCEGGAMPKDLTPFHPDSIQFQSELLEILAADSGRLIDRSAVDIDFILEKISQTNSRKEIRRLEKLSKERKFIFSFYGLFLVTSNPDIIVELQRQSRLVIELYHDDTQSIVYTHSCGLDWLKNAIESGTVVGFTEDMLLECNLNLLGWYVYDCDTSYPLPYNRQKAPKKPIHLQDLSTEIIDCIRVTELPTIKFSETETIQPIEHMPCNTWGMTDYWEGTDGEWHEGFPDYSLPRST